MQLKEHYGEKITKQILIKPSHDRSVYHCSYISLIVGASDDILSLIGTRVSRPNSYGMLLLITAEKNKMVKITEERMEPNRDSVS